MRKEDKSTIIEQIAATVKEYSHFYLIDITAMNAAATSALRRECFKSDIKLMLIKNTLLHKALESLEEDYSPLYNCLKGTTAIMFCYGDVSVFLPVPRPMYVRSGRVR